MGIDRGEIPDLAKAPGSLMDALEAHLANLEGRPPGTPSTGAPPPRPSPPAAMTSSGVVGNGGTSVDEAARQKYLREEEERLEALKVSVSSKRMFEYRTSIAIGIGVVTSNWPQFLGGGRVGVNCPF